MVNEHAEGLTQMRARIRQLEDALRPFVTAHGYASGIDARTGERWCSPKVPHDAMTRAREALS